MSDSTEDQDRATTRSQLKTLMEWSRDFRTSRLLTTAVEREVLDRFGDGPATVASVARPEENQEALRRFVRALASLRLLEQDDSGRFTPSDLTETFLLPDAEFDLRPIMKLFHRNYDLWQRLPETLTEGHGIESEVFGDVEFGPDFMLAMETRAHFAREDVAQAVKPLFGDGDRIIDLGCGTGVFPRAILQEVPGAEVILADLPHVVETAREFSEESDVSDRLTYRELDFFEDETYGQDLDGALLFSICHMFNAERNRTILRRTADALRPGGIVIIRDYVLEDGGVGPLESNLFDLHMLLATDTGENYTLPEYQEILEDAGLTFDRRLPIEGHDELILARKTG